MKLIRTQMRSRAALGAAAMLSVAVLAAACGSSSKTSASSTDTPGSGGASTAATGTPGRGFGNRTPPPAVQTSIAEGTPANAFRGGSGMLTAIAQGTPASSLVGSGMQTAIAEGTPVSSLIGGGAAQTAIAEGTPASSLGRGGGGGRILTALATLLGIDANQLRTELQADGATIATVAAAHGEDRATLTQALISATKQRLDDAVTNGALTQEAADAQVAMFTTNIDTLIDSNGLGGGPGGPGGPGGGGAPGGAPPPAPSP